MGAFSDRIANAWSGIMRPFAPLREGVQRALEGMSPRDRMLLYGMVIFFTAIAIGLGTWGVKGHLDRMEQTLQTRKAQLANVQQMAVDYQDGNEQLIEVEEKLNAFKGTNLSAFLEKCADKVQIRDSLKQVKERGSTTQEMLEEKQFTAQLRPVTLEQLVGFLYEAESSGYPLLIKTLTARTVTSGGVKSLDVTLDISAYKLLEEEASE
ncbi:MAG: hypothetical protein ABIO70_35300 [Pseudomonadota bacterium]